MTHTVANGFPPTVSGEFLIWKRATVPRISAVIPSTGPKKQNIPKRNAHNPPIIDASARFWFGLRTGSGGGGVCHTGVGRCPSAMDQPPSPGGWRGNQIVPCSDFGS